MTGEAIHLTALRDERVLLVCSSGGHLAQLLRLESWWKTKHRLWVTFDKPDARSALADEAVEFAHHPTTRSAKNLVKNALLAAKLMPRFKPDVVISNGAGVAVPFFLLAKAMGIRTVYVEVYDRIDSRTLTGRMVRPFTDLFLVQWAEQQQLYPGSRLISPLY